MDVSVIIPTHNRSTALAKAVQSVLIQKNVSFEILVVDDGSTDDTKQTVSDIQRSHPEIRYFYQSNKGPSSARNFGIKESKADFIAFLDSDDEWRPGKLKAQISFFETHPEYLMCQTEEIWIRDGKRVNPMKKHKKYGGFIFERCLAISVVSPSCVMMKRGFFDQVGGFDESLPVCEDYDLWLRASARFPIGLIETPYVIKYGGHPDQLSHRYDVMDRFRIESLVNLLKGDILNAEQRELARMELIRKTKIVANGAIKRGKPEEARRLIAMTGSL